MKESRFVAQNSSKWADFHKEVASKKKDPGHLSKLFIQITDDLSFARTFYPNRSIRNYLNSLAESIFIQLNRNKKMGFSDVVKFWKTTLPLMNYEARIDFLVSFLVFALTFAIGMLSSSNDKSFPAFILGEDYVEMALENIKKGDPMSVYKEFLPFDGFLQITLNNLLVAARTFVFGVFSAIGTLYIMVYNGVMIGSFQQFYINNNLFIDSFLTIWQHGTIEISSIIIAGAAGLNMGKGMLFPGSYSRMQSFGMSARRGVKIFIGVIPTIILAGFIESFLTRYTEIPNPIRLLFIIASLGVMLAYYVWYPRKVARSVAGQKIKAELYDVSPMPGVDYGFVYNGGRLFENTMLFFGRHFSEIIKTIAAIAVISIALVHFSYGLGDGISSSVNWFSLTGEYWLFFFDYSNYPLMFPAMSMMFAALLFVTFRLFVKDHDAKNRPSPQKLLIRIGIMSVLTGFVLNVLFFLNFWLAYILLLFLLPLLITISFVYVFQKKNLFRAIIHGMDLHFYRFQIPLGLSFKFGILMLVMTLLMFMFFMIFPSMMMELFDIDGDRYELMWSYIDLFGFYLVFFVGIGNIISAMGQMYFTLHEVHSADNLMERIGNFGQSKKILGYERE